MTHTPGPWRVTRYSGDDHDSLVELSDKTLVGSVLTDDRGLKPGDVHLIAAAPDLLRVLRNVDDYFADSRCTAEVYDALRADVAATIQKAEETTS